MKKYCSYSDSFCGQPCSLSDNPALKETARRDCNTTQRQLFCNLLVPKPCGETIKDRSLKSENPCGWQRANLCFCRCSKSVTRFAEKCEPPIENWKCRQHDRNYIRKCLVNGLNDMGIRCLDDQNLKGEMFYLSKQHQKPVLTNTSVHPDAIHPCELPDKQRLVIRPTNPYSCRDKRLKNVELEIRYQAFKECIVGKFERNYWQKNRPVGAQHLYKTFLKCASMSLENMFITTALGKTHIDIQNVAIKENIRPDHNLPAIANTELRQGKMTKKTQKLQQWKTNNIENIDVQLNVLEPHEVKTKLKSPPAKTGAVGSNIVTNAATRKDNKTSPATNDIKKKDVHRVKPPKTADFNESTNVNKVEPLEGISIVNPVKLSYTDKVTNEGTYEVNVGEMKPDILEYQEFNDEKVKARKTSNEQKFEMVNENRTEADLPINQLNTETDDTKSRTDKSKKSKTGKSLQSDNEIEDLMIVNPIATSSDSSEEINRDESESIDNIYKIINSSDKGNKNHKNHAVKTDTPLETQENIKDKLYTSKSGSLIPRHDKGKLKDSKQPHDISSHPKTNQEESDLSFEIDSETNFKQSIGYKNQAKTANLIDSTKGTKPHNIREVLQEISNLSEDMIQNYPGHPYESRPSWVEFFSSPFIDQSKIDEVSNKLSEVIVSRLSIINDTVGKVAERISMNESGFYEFKPSNYPDTMSAEIDNKMENEFVNLESTSSLMIDENSFFKAKEQSQNYKAIGTTEGTDKKLKRRRLNDEDSSGEIFIKTNDQGLSDIVKSKLNPDKYTPGNKMLRDHHLNDETGGGAKNKQKLSHKEKTKTNHIERSREKHDADKQGIHRDVNGEKHRATNKQGRYEKDSDDLDLHFNDQKQHGETKTTKRGHDGELDSDEIRQTDLGKLAKAPLHNKVGKHAKDASKGPAIKYLGPNDERIHDKHKSPNKDGKHATGKDRGYKDGEGNEGKHTLRRDRGSREGEANFDDEKDKAFRGEADFDYGKYPGGKDGGFRGGETNFIEGKHACGKDRGLRAGEANFDFGKYMGPKNVGSRSGEANYDYGKYSGEKDGGFRGGEANVDDGKYAGGKDGGFRGGEANFDYGKHAGGKDGGFRGGEANFDYGKHAGGKERGFRSGEVYDDMNKSRENEFEFQPQKHASRCNGQRITELRQKYSKPSNQILEDEINYDPNDKNLEFLGSAIKSQSKTTKADSEYRNNVKLKSLISRRENSAERMSFKYSQISNVRYFPKPNFGGAASGGNDKCNLIKTSYQNKNRSIISKPTAKFSFQLPKKCVFKFTLMPNQCHRNSEFKLPIKSYCKLINNTAKCTGRNSCGPLIEMDNCRKWLYPSCDVGKGSRSLNTCKNKNIFNVQNMYGMTCLLKPQEYCNKNLKFNLCQK